MPPLMAIGDFSRSTRLTAKALRLYHQMGLLEPAVVDPVSRYRFYAPTQIDDARTIHHLRSLDMPVEEIRRVMAARTGDDRNQVIVEHLERMQRLLTKTHASVTALHQLLEPAPTLIEIRTVPPTQVLAIRAVVDLAHLGSWFTESRQELEDTLFTNHLVADGPMGGLWPTALFLDEQGECALFFPLSDGAAPSMSGRARVETIPPATMAVITHYGTDEAIGQSYAALGAYVADRGIGAPGPLRESYSGGAPTHVGTTEIGWPVHG